MPSSITTSCISWFSFSLLVPSMLCYNLHCIHHALLHNHFLHILVQLLSSCALHAHQSHHSHGLHVEQQLLLHMKPMGMMRLMSMEGTRREKLNQDMQEVVMEEGMVDTV